MANIFDNLLEKLAESDRATFTEIATRNPDIRNFIGDPDKVKRVDDVEKWYAEEWDFEHDMPKKEHALVLKNQELETQLAEAAAKGEGMNLDQLNAYLDERIKDGKVVSAAQMKEEVTGIVTAKEKEFQDYTNNILNSVASTATVVPYLNQRHQQEFGDLFHPNDLLKAANEAKATDLESFYDTKYVAEKRAAKQAKEAEARQAEIDAKIAAAKEEGRKLGLQEKIGEEGTSPSLDGSPEMGHFQSRILRAPTDSEGKPIAKDAILGRGQIAAAAARDADRRELAGAA